VVIEITWVPAATRSLGERLRGGYTRRRFRSGQAAGDLAADKIGADDEEQAHDDHSHHEPTWNQGLGGGRQDNSMRDNK